ncbi:KEOPS complex component [Halovenus sp. WSH3]|uniref:KEOPS complex component n=1 Tax=Halovenus carboxidivorans TaxID=2692199 RepID=A0A6B0TF24_9EURY|nr:KEOPS complex subunit Cgi121 [Halovenus carboxidivorans]MXR51789.1 KEOPS complex component [Halovenus carboxidivorans]
MQIVEGHANIEAVEEFVERIGEIGDEHGVVVQGFDARYVADAAHLRRAVDHAARAIERGETIADDPGVEILLYAAGRRQINRALEMGVSAGDCPLAAVVVDLDSHEWRGDATGSDDRPETDAERAAAEALRGELEPGVTLGSAADEQLRSYFDVTERELAATDGTISDLIRERVTLLVVER